MKRLGSIGDVVRWRLCVGCGACAAHSGGLLRMEDDPARGCLPAWCGPRDDAVLRETLKVCPAAGTRLGAMEDPMNGSGSGIGPVIEVWEGHATDADTRFFGSSGGVLTALARYALERGGAHGVLHAGADPRNVLGNRTVMSRSHGELLANTGSRYSPASVCEGLWRIEEAPGPCVFIGQPSEVAALRKMQALRPALRRNLAVALSFFCAGSPALRATMELLKSRGIDPADVVRLRYRGRGWPGSFAVWLDDGSAPAMEMSYAESWGFLQSWRPWAVHVWPDGCGEHADVACGDPWCRDACEVGRGSSLLVVRTDAGRELVRGAVDAGYLELVPSSVERVVASQAGLIRKKGAVWGRLATMRLCGLPVPRHRGYGLFKLWLRLPLLEKLRSTAGTLRRMLARRHLAPAECRLS
jgi:coenzyme F420 hydrogenase subunit beta